MATIAKGSITLVNVNDAYSVTVTPNACAIKADFDGSNPVLNEAYCDISVVRGDIKVPFTIRTVTVSNNGITYQLSTNAANTIRRMALTAIPSNALSGNVTMDIATDDEFVATVIFQYSVTREATMLDWIRDWESNKTTIGNTYLITPKLFVGTRGTPTEQNLLGELNGVYIGPTNTLVGNTSPGIYGYVDGEDVFHINSQEAVLAGWTLNKESIVSDDNCLRLLSNGTIEAIDEYGDRIWGLMSDGTASFAMGNVVFYEDGNAFFAGEIQSSSGIIGGWTIGSGFIKSSYGHIELNSTSRAITIWGNTPGNSPVLSTTGGVRLYYNSTSDYGIIAYLPIQDTTTRRTFQLGSTNYIAGWNFDNTALWTGTKANAVQIYASTSGSMTIGTAGIRGYGFYIDNTGEISFCNGAVTFNSTEGSMVGWAIKSNRLANANMALISDPTNYSTGLYLTAYGSIDFRTRNAALLEDDIDSHGGIYLKVKADSADFAAYDTTGYRLFKIKSGGTCYIAGWKFDDHSLWTGNTYATSGFADWGCISMGADGIRGYKWRFENDGSGALAGGLITWSDTGAGSIAGGNISWNANGEVTFSASVSLNWMQAIQTSQNTVTALANKLSIISKQMAYGKMLYRDPEFSGSDYNGSGLYLQNNYVSFSVNLVLSTLQASGLLLRGTHATVVLIEKIDINGTVTELYSGNSVLDDVNATTLVTAASLSTITSSDTIRIKWNGESSQIQVLELDGNDNIWHNLIGYSSNEGTGEIHVVREKVTDNTAPNNSHNVLQITDYYWYNETDYRLGGFYFAHDSRANAKFVVRIIAKIPIGFQINNYHNSYGDGGTTEWLTSQAGTGNYEEYMCLVTCGSGGTFSTINHFALTMMESPYHCVTYNTDSIIRYDDDQNMNLVMNSVVWKVAYATVIDLSSSDKLVTAIDVNGIYTGTLRADQIIAGTIDAQNIDANSLTAGAIISNGQAWALNKDGSGYLANGNISWDANATNVEFTGKIVSTSGSIGGFTISNGHIGATTTASDSSFGGLAIYNDFFRVGGSKAYVMFGDDVIPAYAGGAFTAAGRIVNQSPNTYGGYGFDQANYGLFINVSGGTKNYGIHSNAALMAPAFINTKCKLITFTGGSYSLDFSQANIILMYYNESGYSGVTVNLPTEASVASKFGLSSLPSDFATIVIFRTRQGSLPITLAGIYNANESSQNYTLAAGDSIMVLITKADGFRYQVINYSS